jgi:thiol-disulfide isomerase/thioredoxin
LGALYGLFNKISIFGIKVDKKSCVDCGLCISHCKLDVHQVGDQECISCGECMDVCPTNAIQWKGSTIFLKSNDIPKKSNKKVRTITRCISLILMLAILIGSGIYYWKDAAETPLPPAGNAVGDLCYGYDLQVIDSSGILEETINPTTTGKITVVNFWGTWCTPCVNELPYFDQIALEYADNVTVIAIHTHMVIETAPAYIGKYYSDSKLIFAKDYPVDDVGLNGGYYTALGGRGAYPLTVILDENGIIQYNQPGSMEYEDLKAIIEELLQ